MLVSPVADVELFLFFANMQKTMLMMPGDDGDFIVVNSEFKLLVVRRDTVQCLISFQRQIDGYPGRSSPEVLCLLVLFFSCPVGFSFVNLPL